MSFIYKIIFLKSVFKSLVCQLPIICPMLNKTVNIITYFKENCLCNSDNSDSEHEMTGTKIIRYVLDMISLFQSLTGISLGIWTSHLGRTTGLNHFRQEQQFNILKFTDQMVIIWHHTRGTAPGKQRGPLSKTPA